MAPRQRMDWNQTIWGKT